MRAAIDLNIFLDVLQRRAPFVLSSAEVLREASWGKFHALISVHAVTTAFYVMQKASGLRCAEESVDWLLASFAVPAADGRTLRRARQLAMSDFEDAVVAATAEMEGCDCIVTRNIPDFAGSPVRAVTPEDFLKLLASPES
jgi:predicted nucleic acid-binding protein